ncbi:hypothetical protein BOTBODRAFT_410405 [Botryobasidium botryosum FD-172 SS1]|uniref:60S ribosomal protein L36 n=1 Tax=Botryobasidium botryosum (strain FD-172 SS1) TaxID=930990 RepID=A0A067MB33_BOTB1|nr:hypothetical protein BOTBODRAFT_410405 [Botryobasidium botryosum FD-172 SS1]
MPMVLLDLRYGLNAGHPTTPIEKVAKPSHRKGHLSTQTTFVRSVIREVAGFAPYERRVMELMRNSKDKRARKLTKKRVRTVVMIMRLLICSVFELRVLIRDFITPAWHPPPLEAQARGAWQHYCRSAQGPLKRLRETRHITPTCQSASTSSTYAQSLYLLCHNRAMTSASTRINCVNL